MKHRWLATALALCMLASLLPARVIAAPEDTQVLRSAYAAGDQHFLAVKSDGTLWAWGANNFGQLGDGSINHRSSPVKVMDNVAAAYAIGRTSFAVTTDGTLYSWGNNSKGLLGSGDYEHGIRPAPIASGVAGLTLTEDHILAVKADGSLWNWGENVGNQINGMSTCLTPVKVMDDVAQVAAVTDRTMVVKTDGTLWGWGRDGGYGLIGDSGRTDRMMPVRIADGVKKVVVTDRMNMLLDREGKLWTWGLQSNASATRPLFDSYPVFLVGEVKDIAGGGNEGLFLRDNGTAYSHGFDTETRNSTTYYTRYHSRERVKDCAALAQGAGHQAVILKDGTLWAWGANESGQLGDGTTVTRDEPVQVTDNVAEVLIGRASTMALKADGGLWVWGVYGQSVGEDGIGTNITYPFRMMSDMLMPVIVVEPDPIDPRLNEASSWARENITKAIEKGLVPVSLIGSYTNYITRAEFCLQAITFIEAKSGMTIEKYLEERDLVVGLSPFTDTYDRAVIAAFRLGIVSGRSEGIFDPDGDISREEAAVMLTKTAGVLGYPTTAPENTFPDRLQISNWALTSVNYVAYRSVMSGTDIGFEPKGRFTREQADTTFLLLFDALV